MRMIKSKKAQLSMAGDGLHHIAMATTTVSIRTDDTSVYLGTMLDPEVAQYCTIQLTWGEAHRIAKIVQARINEENRPSIKPKTFWQKVWSGWGEKHD